jgi:serine protease
MKKAILTLLLGAMLGCNSTPTHSEKHRDYGLNNPDVIPGEILVDLKDNVSDADAKALEKSVGLHFHERNPTAHKYRFETAKVDPAKEQEILDRLNDDPRVEHAEAQIRVQAMVVPNDPMYGDQWGITRIGSESAWNMTCGMGARVAVVDTGSTSTLSDFAGTKFEQGYNFVDNNEDARDTNLHGSHVAATIAETTNNDIGGAGVAYCATIIPVKVLDRNGSGTMEQVGEGIRYAADVGADVINLSLGAHMPSPVVEDAVNYALDHGVVVVAANGNSGGSIGWPAAYDGVVAVSAIDENDEIAEFSSRGPETAVAAPGVDVLQITVGHGGKGEQYRKLSGTSMASPHTAAVAALIVSQGITKPEAVRAKLQATADAKGDPDEYGAGIVNASAAVRSTIFNHFMWKLVALIGALFLLRKKIDLTAVKSKLSIAGIVASGFGLPILFFTGLLSRLGSFRMIGELASRSFLEWNTVFSFMTKYLPLGYAVPAVLASLVMLNTKLKNLAGGLALGTMALCMQVAWSNDINFFLGGLGLRLVMVGSALASVFFAKEIFTKKN